MYHHGGGWILGSKDTHDRLVRELANGAQAAVVFINFTPSPEAKFPKPVEEAYAALQYISENGSKYNLNPNHLVVAGDSVGGNMAIAMTLLAKERGGPKIDAQVLFYPVTDAGMDTQSYHKYAEGPWLTKAAMEWFWNAYEPNVSNRKKITVSPLQASIDQLKGLPEALIMTDENDVLRDEGEAYAHKLMQAGVDVTSIRFLGTCHDFALLNPLANTPATRGAIEAAIQYLRKVFAH
jgi:acetyl esterase/lipase